MPMTLIQSVGYLLLAVGLGAAYHFLRSPHADWALSLWFGVCAVAGAVGGLWLRRRLRKRRPACGASATGA